MKAEEFWHQLTGAGVGPDYEIHPIILAGPDKSKVIRLKLSGLVIDHDNKHLVIKLSPVIGKKEDEHKGS